MYRHLHWIRAIVLAIMWLGCGRAFADVGLIVENPTGPLGFFSDVGHASIWISRGCLNEAGEIIYCEDSRGIVLSSTSYWPNPGVAAIPAELFFLGSAVDHPGEMRATWDETLSAAYPEVPEEYGRKYLGRVWRRETDVLVFATTADEDRRMLEKIQQGRKEYHYNYLRHNCADYAELILRMYLGNRLRVRHWLDLGLTTPRALQRGLVQALGREPDGALTRYHFADVKRHKWRQPPRNICESAVLDPKYAVPLLLYQPAIYAGFGICYGITRLVSMPRFPEEAEERSSVLKTVNGMSEAQRKKATFAAMTGSSTLRLAAAGAAE